MSCTNRSVPTGCWGPNAHMFFFLFTLQVHATDCRYALFCSIVPALCILGIYENTLGDCRVFSLVAPLHSLT